MLYAIMALAATAVTPINRASPAPAAPTPQAQQQDQATVPTAQARPINYCVVRTPTGSHLRLKTCHTRAEWMDLGFDPLARQN